MTLQTEVTEWAESVFGNSTPKAKLIHLWEELEEAFAEAETDSQQVELADCGLIVMHLASSLAVELPTPSAKFEFVLRAKLNHCRHRTWAAPDDNGVVRHV